MDCNADSLLYVNLYSNADLFLLHFRSMESDRDAEIHENMHLRPVSCVAISKNGNIVVTGKSLRIMSINGFDIGSKGLFVSCACRE